MIRERTAFGGHPQSPVLRSLIAFLLCCLLAPATASAQSASGGPVSVQAKLDRTRATVGDPIQLTITIQYPSNAQVDINNLENQFNPFEVLSATHQTQKRGANGSTNLQLQYQIAAYQTGLLQFPALTIPYTLAGQSASAQSQSLPFNVDSVLAPDDPANTIHPFKPQIDIPLAGPAPVGTIIALAGAIVVLAALALLVWQRQRRPVLEVAPPAVSVASIEEEARAELDRIAAEGLLARGEYPAHYARLAACIRRYLTRRYGFPANALTTSELRSRMERSGVGRWRARLVSDLLNECDAAHYARYQPAAARAEADLQMAYEIVDLSLSQETRVEESELEVWAR